MPGRVREGYRVGVRCDVDMDQIRRDCDELRKMDPLDVMQRVFGAMKDGGGPSLGILALDKGIAEVIRLRNALTFADQQGAEAIERVASEIVNDKWNATAAFQARALKAEAERDALHDRIEGALAAALGNPVMSIHDGDGPVADSLESLIALVASEHASVKRIRAERDEARAKAEGMWVEIGRLRDTNEQLRRDYERLQKFEEDYKEPRDTEYWRGSCRLKEVADRNTRAWLGARLGYPVADGAEPPGWQTIYDAFNAAMGSLECARKETIPELEAERNELRLTLAAEQGKPEGAPSGGWRWEYGEWVHPSATVARDVTDADGWDWGTQTAQGVAPTARAAMQAADKVMKGRAEGGEPCE